MPALIRWTIMADLAVATTRRTSCGSRTSRTSCCRMSRSTTFRRSTTASLAQGLATAERRSRVRHHLLPGPRLLRAGDGALDPGGAAHLRALRRARAGRRNRRPQDQDLRLHQRLRPPPCRPHRHSRPREGRRRKLPADARGHRRRDLLDRRHHRSRLSPPRRSSTPSRPSSIPTSSCAPSQGRTS